MSSRVFYPCRFVVRISRLERFEKVCFDLCRLCSSRLKLFVKCHISIKTKNKPHRWYSWFCQLTCGILYARIILAFLLLSSEQLVSPAPKRKRKHREPDRAEWSTDCDAKCGVVKISNQITPNLMNGVSCSLIGKSIPHIYLCPYPPSQKNTPQCCLAWALFTGLLKNTSNDWANMAMGKGP